MRFERVETEDGLRLDGARVDPATRSLGSPARWSAHAGFLFVHGTGSNFYHAGVLQRFAERVAENGGTAWRVNTRGHDGMSTIPGRNGAVLGGSAFENIADCRFDLRAWTTHAVRETQRPIVLVGHSMGAVKSIYYAAREQPAAVAAIIALSPPRFCHAHWQRHRQAEGFREAWTRATALVAEGNDDALISVTQPVPFVTTAASFVAKYGPHDEYDIVRLLPEVRCPVHLLVGSRSAAASPAFDGLVNELQRIQDRVPGLAVSTIEGANTGYAGKEDVAFDPSAAWLEVRLKIVLLNP